MSGKPRQILTSMTDVMRFPSADIVDLYDHRWEIELDFREMKQSLLDSQFTPTNQKQYILKLTYR